ncbi:unnamed protein product [Lymnaea stagnalis]|uniref:Uncharacterized protein n=1 Tax=Lymnaea stagnalis TaxID=6523 RepID=A0AAV2GXA4_LYMST
MDLKCLLTTITFLATIRLSIECGHVFQKAVNRNGGVNCKSISQFANCLASTYVRIGSPFGGNTSKVIINGLSKAAEDICGFHCDIKNTARPRRRQTAFSPDLGVDFKICAFDFFLEVGGNPQKACDRMPDLVVCFLKVSGTKVSRDALDLGTYIMLHILDAKLGVKCEPPSFSSLRSKCQGMKAS